MTPEWWGGLRKGLGCDAVLVEGGAQIAQMALSTACWNELHVLQSPKPLGQGLGAEPASGTHTRRKPAAKMTFGFGKSL